jgi:hypothetical protein
MALDASKRPAAATDDGERRREAASGGVARCRARGLDLTRGFHQIEKRGMANSTEKQG